MTQSKECKRCGKKLYGDNKTGYCYNCLVITRREEKINNWLNTGEIGMKADTTVRGVIRDYLYKEQNYRCAICNIPNIWNNKELKFVLDHIDGNAANSRRDNLRLICPNCDSQLDTFKSKNKESARHARKDWLKNNNDGVAEPG